MGGPRPSAVGGLPATIQTVFAYILERERGAKDSPCPASLPSAIRSAVTTIYLRHQIQPIPDVENPA